MVKSKYENPQYFIEEEFNETFFKELNDHIEHRKSLKGFMRAYNNVFGIKTPNEEETDKEAVLVEDPAEKSISKITMEIFPRFIKEYNYKNTDKEVYYFNNETNEPYLIHSFSSDYIYEKYSSDIELYEDILTNKNHFNETDELQNSINYYNSITELLDLDLEPQTIEKVKEDLRQGREEKRQYQNEQIEKALEEMTDN